MPTLADCAARWHAQNVLGLTTPTGGAAHLGTSLHHATAAFDQARVEESPIGEDDAVDLFVDKIHKPTEEDGEVVWGSDMPKKKAIDAGVLLMVDYCRNMSPRYTFDKVEVQCEPMTIRMENDVRITLTGTADRVRSQALSGTGDWWDEEGAGTAFGIIDVKSGKRVISSEGKIAVDKHVAQLGTYELIQLLAGNTLGYAMTLPAEIIALPTSGSHTKVASESVEAPSRILLGETIDGKHQRGLLDVAAAYEKNDLWPGNVRSALCSQKFCPIWAKCWWRGHQEATKE